MPTLQDDHRQFEAAAFPADRDLYNELAQLHRPSALFIGCSDARVVPEVITQKRPGELFVIRTAGNLVPAHGTVDAITASIEYAIEVLDVEEIVVCGHSACGAMTSLALGHDLSMLPAVAGWLATAGHQPSDAAVTDEEAVAAAVHANVLRQLANIAAYPAVHKRLTAGHLELTGWVHDIPSGRIDIVRPEQTTPPATPSSPIPGATHAARTNSISQRSKTPTADTAPSSRSTASTCRRSHSERPKPSGRPR